MTRWWALGAGTYRELGLDLSECVSSNSVADLEVGVALLGQDGGTLVVDVLGRGQRQGRGGQEEDGSLDIHDGWLVLKEGGWVRETTINE